jgi:uncharacterized protein (DUF1778 family)
MARPKRADRLVTIRVTIECHELVKEAARIRGESIVDYLSRSAAGAARYDIAAEEARLRAVRERHPSREKPTKGEA